MRSASDGSGDAGQQPYLMFGCQPTHLQASLQQADEQQSHNDKVRQRLGNVEHDTQRTVRRTNNCEKECAGAEARQYMYS